MVVVATGAAYAVLETNITIIPLALGVLGYGLDQMLLRGCILRNVDSAYAFVVYTGRETKVRVRQTTRARKVAQVEQMLNKLIAMLVATLVLACALGAIGAGCYKRRRDAARSAAAAAAATGDRITRDVRFRGDPLHRH
jgi:magnesium-transporting ATPase (P-type)